MSDSSLPLVSIGMPVWNGELFLSETIDSLLTQDYRNIELVILDNLSTDKTAEICARYAQQDSRVKYILDTRQRDVCEAFKEIVLHLKGDYFMVGCDDDVYAPNYISFLMRILLDDPGIGLAYCACKSINPDGTIQPTIWKWRLTQDGSKFGNFIKYFFKRAPIPICFGIMKTEVHLDGLTYFVRPDNWGFNHENLYMLRILIEVKVHSIPEELFFYRNRDRGLLYKNRNQIDNTISPLAYFRELFFHQLNVSKISLKIVARSNFNILQKLSIYVYIFVCTIYFSMGYIVAIPTVRFFKKLFIRDK